MTPIFWARRFYTLLRLVSLSGKPVHQSSDICGGEEPHSPVSALSLLFSTNFHLAELPLLVPSFMVSVNIETGLVVAVYLMRFSFLLV